jgi:hypothetical protein
LIISPATSSVLNNVEVPFTTGLVVLDDTVPVKIVDVFEEMSIEEMVLFVVEFPVTMLPEKLPVLAVSTHLAVLLPRAVPELLDAG